MRTTQQESRAIEHDVLAGGARNEEQQVASGRAPSTPFVVIGAVACAIAVVAAVVVGLTFLVLWLA